MWLNSVWNTLNYVLPPYVPQFLEELESLLDRLNMPFPIHYVLFENSALPNSCTTKMLCKGENTAPKAATSEHMYISVWQSFESDDQAVRNQMKLGEAVVIIYTGILKALK